MALTPFPSSSYPNLLQLSVKSPSPSLSTSTHYLLFGSPCPTASPSKIKYFTTRSFTKEDRLNQPETLAAENVGSDYDEFGGTEYPNSQQHLSSAVATQRITTSSGDSPSLGIREPVYEVVEVKSNGVVSTRKINRRQLLKSSGLRPRDIRSVDPSLFLTNSGPSLLVREHAILLTLGSLRAIAMRDCVLIFDYHRKGGKAFMDTLLPRLNAMNGGHCMPFELEVVEAALLSRIQRLEQRLMDIEPRCRDGKRVRFRGFRTASAPIGAGIDIILAGSGRVWIYKVVPVVGGGWVQALLEELPYKLTADILEQLRIGKQNLVELGSRAGALRQMLLDLLEDPHEIRRICIIGRNCTLKKGTDEMECSLPLEKMIAEEEEEEIEMLLENYLQRCESCHGQAERLLDSAKEMEDSIAVNLSSRRLEVSRVELLLQVGTFCVAVGALVAAKTRIGQMSGYQNLHGLPV
ncbi:Magnesium transporter MRS2-A [Hibiscus syriacus]|uniref:Magnesium transporter n=1 Tax=Hibiscus syriacus TaxID=106335 RepID=A0A6A3BZ61_HIBSY|nr:Magnesium transporter MRS2-A [Hibiscus syriacus]